MNSSLKIVGLGEILWDVFPAHQRLGGAPSNFAYHCQQLGADAFPVSAIGVDDLGALTREQLHVNGVKADYVQEAQDWPTSRVMVTLDDQGKPQYDILEDVAWDHLEYTDQLSALASEIDAACFGVLSQRSSDSRSAIRRFLKDMSDASIKVLDVNLRQSYYSKELIEESLELATVLKLSDEELPLLAEYFSLEGSVQRQLATLWARFKLDTVAYTRGAEGSILIQESGFDVSTGVETDAIDSVGAGDSFTAALCVGLLQGWPIQQVNVFANEVAAFVCSQQGATPELPEHLRMFKRV